MAAAAVGLVMVGGVVSVAIGADPPPRPSLPSVPGLSCRARASGGDWLPDPVCTPGLASSQVTQANLASTICRPGWATRVRRAQFPPSRAAEVKKDMMLAYADYAGPDEATYQLDHLVPISLGGDPADPRNLWVEAGGTPNAKDRVESWARGQVCAGRLLLRAAQREIAADWRQLDAGDTTRQLSGGDVDE